MDFDNFIEAFSNAELKRVKLESLKGKVDDSIFLRAIPYAKQWHFRILATKVSARRSIGILSSNEDSANVYEEDLLRAEDYLVREAMANEDGSQFFKDDEKFKEFRDTVPPGLMNEIIFHIEQMNFLDDEFLNREFLEEQASAKKKSLSMTGTPNSSSD